MTIEKINEIYWENTRLKEMENECLCLNCERTRENSPYSPCQLTSILDKLCVKNNLDMIVTRCGARDNILGKLLYVPRR